MNNVQELFGAITTLSIVINALEEDFEKRKFVPGVELLLQKLKELSNQLNVEVAEIFNGALTNLYNAVAESKEDEEDDL